MSMSVLILERFTCGTYAYFLNNAHPCLHPHLPFVALLQPSLEQLTFTKSNMAHKKTKDGEDVAEIADNLWRFLDKLHAKNPAEYKKFIDEQMEEGKKLLTPPEPVYCLHCQARAWVREVILFYAALVCVVFDGRHVIRQPLIPNDFLLIVILLQ